MPTVASEIDYYEVNYVSDSGATVGVNACQIDCFKSSVFVARICFTKASLSLPANAVYSGAPYLYFPLSQFGDIIGILRHEKLLNLSLDTDSLVGQISGQRAVTGTKTK